MSGEQAVAERRPNDVVLPILEKSSRRQVNVWAIQLRKKALSQLFDSADYIEKLISGSAADDKNHEYVVCFNVDVVE